MAYSETSVYEYITGDELEAFAVQTYLSVDARYTEAVVMAKVSVAERIINEICRKSFTSPIPDGVVAATILIAERLMFNQMVKDGKAMEGSEKVKEFIDQVIEIALKNNKTTTSVGVDSIPMSGASRASQTSDYY